MWRRTTIQSAPRRITAVEIGSTASATSPLGTVPARMARNANAVRNAPKISELESPVESDDVALELEPVDQEVAGAVGDPDALDRRRSGRRAPTGRRRAGGARPPPPRTRAGSTARRSRSRSGRTASSRGTRTHRAGSGRQRGPAAPPPGSWPTGSRRPRCGRQVVTSPARRRWRCRSGPAGTPRRDTPRSGRSGASRTSCR